MWLKYNRVIFCIVFLSSFAGISVEKTPLFLSRLPEPALEIIRANLSMNDVSKLRLVCKEMNQETECISKGMTPSKLRAPREIYIIYPLNWYELKFDNKDIAWPGLPIQDSYIYHHHPFPLDRKSSFYTPDFSLYKGLYHWKGLHPFKVSTLEEISNKFHLPLNISMIGSEKKRLIKKRGYDNEGVLWEEKSSFSSDLFKGIVFLYVKKLSIKKHLLSSKDLSILLKSFPNIQILEISKKNPYSLANQSNKLEFLTEEGIIRNFVQFIHNNLTSLNFSGNSQALPHLLRGFIELDKPLIKLEHLNMSRINWNKELNDLFFHLVEREAFPCLKYLTLKRVFSRNAWRPEILEALESFVSNFLPASIIEIDLAVNYYLDSYYEGYYEKKRKRAENSEDERRRFRDEFILEWGIAKLLILINNNPNLKKIILKKYRNPDSGGWSSEFFENEDIKNLIQEREIDFHFYDEI